MKTLNIKNMSKARQQGFTIIELVVVILLLGILTATALPRFMDVTDEAHVAVVDAVRGGLNTGNALFRAQYVGEGEPVGAVVAGFGAGTLIAGDSGSGYPTGTVDGVIDADAVDCLAIYNGVLQSGRPGSVGVAAPHAGDAITEDAIEDAAAVAGSEFVVTPDHDTTPTGCHLYYLGQFQSGNTTLAATIPLLSYTLATGEIVEETSVSFNQLDN